MNALASLLSHPAIWRGNELGRVTTPSVPSGYAQLDAELPGGGWPTAALTEILPQHEGIGELGILGHALAKLAAEGRWLAWIAPPYLPYAPALAAAGIDLSRLLIIRTRSPRETLWAFEQALRSQTCGAVLAWPDKIAYAELRRLQLAAEGSSTLAMLFRPPRCITEATPAALRLRLDTQAGGLAVRILKRRGGVLGRTIMLTPPQMPSRMPSQTLSQITQRNFSDTDGANHVVDRIAFPAPAARSVCADLGIN
jgi:cell division inhibitor SulA/protein ImuA